MITTIDEAKHRLNDAALDVQRDMGEAALEAGWHDLVHAIASDCTPDVRDELLRRERRSVKRPPSSYAEVIDALGWRAATSEAYREMPHQYSVRSKATAGRPPTRPCSTGSPTRSASTATASRSRTWSRNKPTSTRTSTRRTARADGTSTGPSKIIINREPLPAGIALLRGARRPGADRGPRVDRPYRGAPVNGGERAEWLMPYMRKSSGEDEQNSLARQRQSIRPWAKLHNITLTAEVWEAGVSGSKHCAQGALGQAIAACERGEAGGIIVEEQSRLSRENGLATAEVCGMPSSVGRSSPRLRRRGTRHRQRRRSGAELRDQGGARTGAVEAVQAPVGGDEAPRGRGARPPASARSRTATPGRSTNGSGPTPGAGEGRPRGVRPASGRRQDARRAPVPRPEGAEARPAPAPRRRTPSPASSPTGCTSARPEARAATRTRERTICPRRPAGVRRRPGGRPQAGSRPGCRHEPARRDRALL